MLFTALFASAICTAFFQYAFYESSQPAVSIPELPKPPVCIGEGCDIQIQYPTPPTPSNPDEPEPQPGTGTEGTTTANLDNITDATGTAQQSGGDGGDSGVGQHQQQQKQKEEVVVIVGEGGTEHSGGGRDPGVADDDASKMGTGTTGVTGEALGNLSSEGAGTGAGAGADGTGSAGGEDSTGEQGKGTNSGSSDSTNTVAENSGSNKAGDSEDNIGKKATEAETHLVDQNGDKVEIVRREENPIPTVSDTGKGTGKDQITFPGNEGTDKPELVFIPEVAVRPKSPLAEVIRSIPHKIQRGWNATLHHPIGQRAVKLLRAVYSRVKAISHNARENYPKWWKNAVVTYDNATQDLGKTLVFLCAAWVVVLILLVVAFVFK
ncbi:hypothetical protein Pelo_3103 [Pelomyxa schiedti]|nr:hypothetical protein Pelo_3103 [Pelomyxa schiedti]